jgi:hypothetical protein
MNPLANWSPSWTCDFRDQVQQVHIDATRVTRQGAITSGCAMIREQSGDRWSHFCGTTIRPNELGRDFSAGSRNWRLPRFHSLAKWDFAGTPTR